MVPSGWEHPAESSAKQQQLWLRANEVNKFPGEAVNHTLTWRKISTFYYMFQFSG